MNNDYFLGYELHISRDNAEAIYDALMLAGNEFGLKNAGYRALYSLSCEKGYHLWGSDVRSVCCDKNIFYSTTRAIFFKI